MYFPNALREVSVLLAVVSTVQAIPSFRAGGSGSKHTSYKTDTETDPQPDPATVPHNGTYDDVIGCKTLYDPKTMAKEEHHFRKMRARLRSHHKGKYTDDNPYWFPIWFHVNYADETMKGGNVLAWQIEQQMYRLNLDFAGTGFKFKYMGTKRYHNPKWFYSGVGTDMALDQAQMTEKRIGDVKTLNVYTVGPFSPWYYAYAYYPSNYASWPGLDGVLTSIDVLPGGAQEGNNIGKILAHEVGHWLGLKHTFEGYSCSGPGDDVEDTPQHTGPSWGCEVKLNTCGGADELYDPVFNFMNYADRDYCMSQFTKGQIDRMWDQARVYRSVP